MDINCCSKRFFESEKLILVQTVASVSAPEFIKDDEIESGII